MKLRQYRSERRAIAREVLAVIGWLDLRGRTNAEHWPSCASSVTLDLLEKQISIQCAVRPIAAPKLTPCPAGQIAYSMPPDESVGDVSTGSQMQPAKTRY
ncbi:MAG: hypothetical protein HC869_18480 [Rhodospirillales bacterium]|nr:hypothetical protein [Rhodospirillales bacterium]